MRNTLQLLRDVSKTQRGGTEFFDHHKLLYDRLAADVATPAFWWPGHTVPWTDRWPVGPTLLPVAAREVGQRYERRFGRHESRQNVALSRKKRGRPKATQIKDDAYVLHATGNVEPQVFNCSLNQFSKKKLRLHNKSCFWHSFVHLLSMTPEWKSNTQHHGFSRPGKENSGPIFSMNGTMSLWFLVGVIITKRAKT